MSVIDDLYELLDRHGMKELGLDSDASVVDPLGTEFISITAQVREGCQTGEGSWIQMAQEFGFESEDGSW